MHTSASLKIGDILHWKNFQFSDSERKNKYFVVIGAKDGRDYLFVIATSQQHRANFVPGCNAELVVCL